MGRHVQQAAAHSTQAKFDPFQLFVCVVALFPLAMALRARLASRASGAKAYDGRKLELPLRSTLAELLWLERCKTLVNFFLFFALYTLLTTLRVDWWKGTQTLHWLDEAHEGAGLQPISSAETTEEVALMLEDGIPAVISHLKSICKTCGVGVTPEQQDLAFLGLDSFICSDFDSLEGVTSYPPRDCAEADATWAAAPSSRSAPCCGDPKLVTASIAMMVEALVYGTTTMPLRTLLNGGSDPSFSSTEYFVRHYIDSYQFIMQLVVSQRGRMAAVQYHANWVDREDAPERLTPRTTYWSFNYQASGMLDMLRLMMLAMAANSGAGAHGG